MSNYCTTNYNIEGAKEELDALEENIKKALAMNLPGVNWQNWLGNFLIQAGACSLETALSSVDDFNCRGFVEDGWQRISEEQIEINVSTAWTPMHAPMIKMVEKFAPHSEILYTSVEPGMEIFEKNDPEAEDYVLIEYDDEDLPESMHDMNEAYLLEDDVREILQEALDTDEEDVDTLVETFNEKYEDAAHFFKFEDVPLDYEPKRRALH